MLAKLLHTGHDRTLTWLRVVAGTTMFVHGAQKMLGSLRRTGLRREYHILFGAAVVPVIIRGAGAWSIDRWLDRWFYMHQHTPVREFRGAHAH